MRPLARLVLIALGVSVAAPAAAQIVGRPVYDPVPPSNPFIGDSRSPRPGVGREVRDTRSRIHQAVKSGAISRGEARRLRREARLIGRLARRYGADGLSASEEAELEARALYLRDAVNRTALR